MVPHSFKANIFTLQDVLSHCWTSWFHTLQPVVTPPIPYSTRLVCVDLLRLDDATVVL
jgi:hypothetical protein